MSQCTRFLNFSPCCKSSTTNISVIPRSFKPLTILLPIKPAPPVTINIFIPFIATLGRSPQRCLIYPLQFHQPDWPSTWPLPNLNLPLWPPPKWPAPYHPHPRHQKPLWLVHPHGDAHCLNK